MLNMPGWTLDDFINQHIQGYNLNPDPGAFENPWSSPLSGDELAQATRDYLNSMQPLNTAPTTSPATVNLGEAFRSAPNPIYDPNYRPDWLNNTFGNIIGPQVIAPQPLEGYSSYGDYINYLNSDPDNPLGYTQWRENPLSPVERIAAENPNLWQWGGINPLGGQTQNDISPHLGIQSQYLSAPVEAASWQEAVRQSLEGFMRVQPVLNPNITTLAAPAPPPPANRDPVTMWDAASGVGNSQFRVGTLQDLIQDPSIGGLFYDTGIPRRLDIVQDHLGNEVSRQWVNAMTGDPLGQSNMIDPLQGLDPSTKILAFEDTPMAGALEQILGPNMLGTSDMDFNDFIFSLDINPYQPGPETITRTPEMQLAEFFNTPGYQLLFGNPESVPQAFDPYLTPEQRFVADPGYQFQQSEGLRQLERRHAAQGMLESGSGLRSLQSFSQNLADQSYNQYLQKLNGAWNNYQQGISGIANMGAQYSNPSLGLQLAGLTEGTGNDLASLLGNQGIFGSNAIINTGAAQANTSMQSASLLAQIQMAQAQANAQIQAANAASGGGGGGGIGQIIGAAGSLFGK